MRSPPLIEAQVERILYEQYGLQAPKLTPMTTGVGGTTYRVDTDDKRFVFKIADANHMNHPEVEPEICAYLASKQIPVSEFVRRHDGTLLVECGEGRIGHLQTFVDGVMCKQNQAPQWLMREMPQLLGDLHRALLDFRPLPDGIGKDFLANMTPERAVVSYRTSMDLAQAAGDEQILDELATRIRIAEKMRDWRFDLSKLTCRNSHGDFTVHQMICGDDKINAVIDWTSACTHPVIWEITRSYFYGAPCQKDGVPDITGLAEYAMAYESRMPLSPYDRDHLLQFYLFQLAVCDYYSQYFHAEEKRKQEFLTQARFATKVLMKYV